MNIRLILIIIAAVALAALAFSLTKRRNVDTPREPVVAVEARTFPTWKDFVASEDMGRERHKVVFVGVDGGAWNIIDPMIARGALPNFERLKNQGSHGVLRSVECYVSPPAWATLTTGYLPGKTGIYTFGHWDADSAAFLPLSADDIVVPSVWDIASLAGLSTAVVNVPLTYPVREVDGIMVSGLLTPTTLADRAGTEVTFAPFSGAIPADGAPPSFAEIQRASFEHNGDRFDVFLLDASNDNQTAYDHVFAIVQNLDDAQDRQSYSFHIGGFSPWIKVRMTDDHRSPIGWAKIRLYKAPGPEDAFVVAFSHTLFDAETSDVEFTYPDTLGAALVDEFGYYFPSKFVQADIVPSFTEDGVRFATFFSQRRDWDLFFYVFTQTDNVQHLTGDSPLTVQVYQTIDRFLGELMNELPENSTLIIASDHGFKEYQFGIDLNRLFEQAGILTYTPNGDVDHDKTLAFHNLWCVYFNESLMIEAEFAARNIEITPGASLRDALAAHVRRAGQSILIQDRRTGQNVEYPVEFIDVPSGSIGHAPDLLVNGTYTNYMVEFWNFTRPRPTVFRELGLDERWNHTRDGIYIVSGKDIRRGFSGPTENIQNIAPTILYLLGLPVGPHMDGRVMGSIFREGYVAGHPIAIVDDYETVVTRVRRALPEEEDFEKKLRSLGYIR